MAGSTGSDAKSNGDLKLDSRWRVGEIEALKIPGNKIVSPIISS